MVSNKLLCVSSYPINELLLVVPLSLLILFKISLSETVSVHIGNFHNFSTATHFKELKSYFVCFATVQAHIH